MHCSIPIVLTVLTAFAHGQATWTQLFPAASPTPSAGALLTCFEPTGEMVLVSPQSWRLLGTTWSTFPSPPQFLPGCRVVYDSWRQRLVMFGGYIGTAGSNELWEWDGAQWTNPSPVLRPSPRGDHGMAFDRERGVTVVFGGNDSGHLGDVWEWDGVSWTQRAATAPLNRRVGALMAFDPVLGEVLVHGGTQLVPMGPTGIPVSIPLADTWSWDGANWTSHGQAPSVSAGAAMVTDFHRARVVRSGGGSTTATLEWNGSSWQTIAGPSPGERHWPAMGYDAVLRRVVLFGGMNTGTWLADTWQFQTPLPADVTPFGAGCAGSAGVPVLSNAPYVYPWLGDTMRNVVQPLPAGGLGAVFVSSFNSTPPVPLAPLGAPGCDLLVPVDVVDFRSAGGNVAEWSLAIPNVPALAGVTFRQQAFVIDPPANPLGLVASGGVVVTLGVR